MKVAIMCGGKGNRMVPVTKDKALLDFLGQPLIIHQINSAIKAGLNHFVIIANSSNFSDLKSLLSGFKDAKIEFGLQEKSGGMANALLSVSDLLSGEPFILVNSNDIFDTSVYTNLLDEFNTDGSYSSYLTASYVQSYFPGGYLVVNEKNDINQITEKPQIGTEPSNLINIVVHLHNETDSLLEELKNTNSDADDLYEKSLDKMLKDGNKMKAVVYNGLWQAIKYPWHILNAMEYFSNYVEKRISPNSIISDKAVIEDKVIIEDNVRVLEGAIIRGPSYIGRNSIIGNGALIRDSFIGSDCVVGYGTEIKHSYIGNKCWFHTNYIGDSIIESDCSFGSGAVTANFRLDESTIGLRINNDKIDTGRDKLGAIIGKGCRIGINASIMPGIRVGADSFVGAHVYLTHDLESGKKALSKSQYITMPNNSQPAEDKRKGLLKKLTD
jgi:bifunctional UDP-N-acetylglucosamine pyrophosphorylase/glucosamine-1-phosphate N-acetyltransferase